MGLQRVKHDWPTFTSLPFPSLLHWVLIATHKLPLLETGGGGSPLAMPAARCAGFSPYGAQALEISGVSKRRRWARTQQAGSAGLGAAQQAGSSWTGAEPVSPIWASGFLTTGSLGSLGKSTFKGLLMVQKCRIEQNQFLRHLNFSAFEIKLYKIIITWSL